MLKVHPSGMFGPGLSPCSEAEKTKAASEIDGSECTDFLPPLSRFLSALLFGHLHGAIKRQSQYNDFLPAIKMAGQCGEKWSKNMTAPSSQ
jgi:hypothetical protein